MNPKSKKAQQNTKIAWRFAAAPRSMMNTEADAKMYGGHEPTWSAPEEQLKWTKAQMDGKMLDAFNWYNRSTDYKKAIGWVQEFIGRNPRRAQWSNALKNVSPGDVPQSVGYLCRMGRMGFVLRPYHLKHIIKVMRSLMYKQASRKQEEPKVEEKPIAKFNIQDRLNEKFQEAMGELEGRFDSFIADGCKGQPDAIAVLTGMNIHVQKIKDAISLYEQKIEYWREVIAGKDSQLVEAHINLGKRELKAIIAWHEKAIADFRSFETVKKVNRKVRVKKPVSPEKKVSKLAYLKEFAELKLKSVDPTQILTASELWIYDTKKRKLGVYIADPHVSKLDIKGSKILGFDASTSVQKRLRKPAEQLKAFEANGKPAAKKWFKGIRSVETMLKGRITKETILLKAFK